jgi:hypothetical protein
LHIKSNAKPAYIPSEPVAYAFEPKVDAELMRLQSIGIITPISYSEWAAQVVAERKSNGNIRL